MRTVFLPFLLTAILSFYPRPAFSIEREGHAGDPFQLDFLHRAQFVLSELRDKRMVGNDMIGMFESAVADLRVEMSQESLPAVGWVVKDPERPGKREVLLDRAKYLYSFDRADKIDLNLFVAHEVWETLGVDENKEITQYLRFQESDYVRWYEGQYSGRSTPAQAIHAASPGYGGEAVVASGNSSIIAPPGDTIVTSNGSNVVTTGGNGVIVTRGGAVVVPAGGSVIDEPDRIVVSGAPIVGLQ